MRVSCRRCGFAFDWGNGEGYAQLPDGSYLCSANCELADARAELARLREENERLLRGEPEAGS